VPPTTPTQLHEALTAAFNAHDLDALLALYEPDALLVTRPGRTVRGTAAISGAFAVILSLRPTFTIETGTVLEAGDLALLHSTWQLRGTGPDGAKVENSGKGADIARRQADGSWLLAVDNAYAADS
jgi:uncharacterized protein (TIGR02246 family)